MPYRLQPRHLQSACVFACLFAFQAGHPAEVPRGPETRVLERAPGRLRLEIRLPPMRVDTVPGQGLRVSCAGCQLAPAGSPDLPVLRVDVPGGGELRARVTFLESEPLPLERLASVPVPVEGFRVDYRPDIAAAAAMARGEVRALDPGRIRGLPVRGVLIPLARPAGSGAVSARRLEADLSWDPRSEAGPRRPPSSAGKRGGSPTIQAAGVQASSSSFADLGESFIRIRIGDATVESLAEDQVYALSFRELAGKSRGIQGGVRIADLRLYTGPRDSLPRAMDGLPEMAGALAGALREIPLEVIDDGDGTFDEGDSLKFFAHGTSLWKRAPGAGGKIRFTFAADPYAFQNSYYLAYSGRSEGAALRLEHPPAGAAPGAGGNNPASGSNPAYLRAEREATAGGCEYAGAEELGQGSIWFWHVRGLCRTVPERLLAGGQLASPEVDTLQDWESSGEAVLVGFRTFPRSPSDGFRVHLAGSREPLPHGTEAASDGDAWYAWDVGDGSLPAGGAFRLDSAVWTGGSLALEGYSVRYPRRLAWRGKPLWIFPETGGRVAWRVSGGGGLSCLRIVAGVAERLLRLDAQGRFEDSLPGDADALYLVYSGAATLPGEAFEEERLPPSGGALRDLAGGGGDSPEYLILAPMALEREALALRDYRRDPRRVRPLRTSVVRLEDVYRNFASGRASPVAVRDFLRWALHRWHPGGAQANPLRYILLYGNGHYDYRGIEARRAAGPPLYVPTYQGYGAGSGGMEVIASDDFYARLDSGEADFGDGGLDLALGRLPVLSPGEAGAYLEKVKAWEDPAKAGEWRSRVLFAADDHLQRGGKGDGLDGIREGHTNDTEKLVRTVMARDPGAFVERVYLLDYPINSANRKPQASQDLLGFFNRGLAALTFVGHGSPDQWADEVLLQTSDVAAGLSNRDRTPMVNSFSCAVGRYDAFLPGLSQALVAAPGKGAIAALSATRESLPGPNIALAEAFYSRAFPADSAAEPASVGQALVDAKNLRGSGRNADNDAKYNLLGEPVIFLRKPRLNVALTAHPDTLRALDCGVIAGTVAGGSGSGYLSLKILGGPEPRKYDLPQPMDDQAAERRGPVLYSQTVPYRDGRFSLEYLVPARLPFGDTAARITVFAWDGARELEGSAALEGMHVRGGALGGACAASSDGTGPAIRVAGCEPGESGGVDLPERVRLSLPACLQISIEDSTGGVLSAQGPDEGTVVEIPGALDPFHPQPGVDELYVKTYRLTLESRDFRPGPYLLKVSAQDGFGNRSLRHMRLDLGKESSLRTVAAYNVPNPVKRSGTAFYFSAMLPSPDVEVVEGGGDSSARAEFEVRIHDQRGRLVKMLRKAQSGQRWDGRDEWGKPLANGVYFYSVTARWERDQGAGGAGSRVVSSRRNTLILSR